MWGTVVALGSSELLIFIIWTHKTMKEKSSQRALTVNTNIVHQEYSVRLKLNTVITTI